MRFVIDDAVRAAGKALRIGIVAVSIAGCASHPPFQPKDDYKQYPHIETEIAVYNLDAIFKANCDEGAFVTEKEFYCPRTRCANTVPSFSAHGVRNQCFAYETNELKGKWKDVFLVTADDGCVKFNLFPGCEFFTQTPEQAKAVVKGFEVLRPVYQRPW